MKPTSNVSSWIVWTDDRIHGAGFAQQTSWRWAAHGPLGADTGVAVTAEEAVQRAYGAAMLNATSGAKT